MGDMADWDLDNAELSALMGDDCFAETVACKYCGKDGLYWSLRDNGRWRLVNDNDDLHTCIMHPAVFRKILRAAGV